MTIVYNHIIGIQKYKRHLIHLMIVDQNIPVIIIQNPLCHVEYLFWLLAGNFFSVNGRENFVHLLRMILARDRKGHSGSGVFRDIKINHLGFVRIKGFDFLQQFLIRFF